MTEQKEDKLPKPRLESLSDLIFGLALSIGALTLIGQQPGNFQQLVFSILYYGFSFIILINVWYSYTRTMSLLRFETQRSVNLNIFLLFLVSIEPFLFNQQIHSTLALEQYISIIYALDLGGLFVILAFLANAILADKNRPLQVLYTYEARRYSEVFGAALFFISILPFFWIWKIPVGSTTSIPLRFILWLIPLFNSQIRRLWEHQLKKNRH